MVKREYVIARIERAGQRFEILVNPELALKLREGERVSLRDLLVGDIVYRDARRGLKASEDSLLKAFKTTDIYKIAEMIVKHGEIQLTAEQRRKIIESKKRQIIAFIVRNCIDPRTGAPHTPARIEKAMEEARVGVDPFKDVESQALEVIKAISRILPIKVAKAYIEVRIPPAYSGRAYQALAGMGTIKKSRWLSDGSLVMEIEIPAGMRQELIDRVNKLTKGEGVVKILYQR